MLSIRPVQLGPAPSPLTPGARQRYELHEGLLGMANDGMQAIIDRAAAEGLGQASAHAGMSLEHTLEQFTALVAYVRLAELISDRTDRSMHASHIQMLLSENERILQTLDQRAMGDPSLPTTADLVAVIVSERSAEMMLGPIDSIEPIPDTWSQRPWIWEGQFWDVDYNLEQQRLRDRQAAFNATGIRIPKPVLLQWPEDIARFSSVCTAPR